VGLFQSQCDYLKHAFSGAQSRSVPFRSLIMQDTQNTWKQNNFQKLWQSTSSLLLCTRVTTWTYAACAITQYLLFCTIWKSCLKNISFDCWRQHDSTEYLTRRASFCLFSPSVHCICLRLGNSQVSRCEELQEAELLHCRGSQVTPRLTHSPPWLGGTHRGGRGRQGVHLMLDITRRLLVKHKVNGCKWPRATCRWQNHSAERQLTYKAAAPQSPWFFCLDLQPGNSWELQLFQVCTAPTTMVTESLRLEETSKIIKSIRPSSPTVTTTPCIQS